MAANLTKNKLHVSWSDSSFFPWLNETTVLDYFCDVRNPFYNIECNNQFLKMQGGNPEALSSMVGYEYQLHFGQPPLYIIRKVQRTSQKEVIPLSYYYILHGVVYQAPDLMSVLSSRLEMISHYLGECLETSFDNYKFNPSKGYYWEFNQNEESKKKDLIQQQKSSNFQRERVDPLLQEFCNRFPPFKLQEQELNPKEQENIEQEAKQIDHMAESKNFDQPAEKKMKMNTK